MLLMFHTLWQHRLKPVLPASHPVVGCHLNVLPKTNEKRQGPLGESGLWRHKL